MDDDVLARGAKLEGRDRTRRSRLMAFEWVLICATLAAVDDELMQDTGSGTRRVSGYDTPA